MIWSVNNALTFRLWGGVGWEEEEEEAMWGQIEGALKLFTQPDLVSFEKKWVN